MKNNNYGSLFLWIVVLIAIGSFIGFLTKPEVSDWYSTLNISVLTPPNYVFPIAWTILYGIIGICGWIIWRAPLFSDLRHIKILYVIQLILNWSWTPLFFGCHLIGLSLLVLSCMDVLVGTIIWIAYPKLRAISIMMASYLLWILFASYLNFYIWLNN